MRKTWALVMAGSSDGGSIPDPCSSSKPAETAAPETEAETAETEETEAEATGDQQEILVAAAASLQYVMEDKIQPAFEKRESGHQAELYFLTVQESCRPRSKRAQMQTYSSLQR